MNQNDTLIQLVEQAACCVNMLGPSDLSDARQLEEILSRIDRTVHELDRGSDPLRTQMEGVTAEATQTLQQVLGQEVNDTSQALNAIAKAICSLQGLARQLDGSGPGEAVPSPAPVPAEPASESAGPASSEPAVAAAETPAAPEAMTISPDDAPLVVDFITEAAEHIENAESALLELENHPDNEELINKIFRGFHTIKGMAGFLNLTDIGSLAHSAENLLDLARKGKLVLAGENSDAVFASVDMLKRMLACLKEAMESGAPVPRQDQLPALLETLKAAAEGRTPAVSVRPPQTKADDERLDIILEDKTETKKAASSGAAAHAAADDKIKVSITRLDNLINMTGELVIAQLMVAEEIHTGTSSTHDLARKVAHQGKIVRELQELSMSMRMVPVQGVFQKMSRLARDLSRKADKQVDFVTVGEETELDRTVVDKIADPLIHMVRNSLDHGVEPSADRVKAGKNATGHVELRAFHQAGNIVIEIEDDGKGLDKDRILKKAIDTGVVEPGQELSEEEIFKLIFHPGLSTAEKITSVSGRGVGMDVVKKNIESLRGKIEISSARGKGTTFTIRLPLTLAVIDGQVVSIGDQRYIIPINAIVRSLRPTSRQISSVQGRGEMILERGELIPLVRLYRLLGAVPTEEDPTKALVVVVEEDGKKCCLLVDDLLAQQQVVIKSLGDALGRVRGVSGGAIMGDGKVCLILDIPGLVALAQAQ